jgi:hypothetical protein
MSNQTLQCTVVTIRCYPWSAGSWQVFHIVGLCVFSHQSADYSILVAHLMSYRLVMQMNHASHALLKIQYVHASNLGI